MPHSLSVRGLVKTFTAHGPRVLDGLSFGVGAGELFVLLGPSGSGKTTLLRIVAGLAAADDGAVLLDDRTLSAPRVHVAPSARGVGMVFQSAALFPHLSVMENVIFGLRPLPRPQRLQRAIEALEIAHVLELRDRLPSQLSGGEEQRVALARALAPRPHLLLLDEPFNNLDAPLRARLREEFRELVRSLGVTTVLVTHDPAEALSVADRMGALIGGTVVQEGDPAELYARPRTARVATLLGPVNIIPGDADGDVAQTPLGSLPLNRPAVGAVSLALRPESLRLRPAIEGDRAGIVRSVANLGPYLRFEVTLDEHRFVIAAASRPDFGAGDRVRIEVAGRAAVLED